MSKDKEPKSQQTIEGASDKVTRRVRDAAAKYAKTLCERQRLQKDEAVLKPSLDEKMEEDGVQKLEVAFQDSKGESVRYEVKRGVPKSTAKITCKKLSPED